MINNGCYKKNRSTATRACYIRRLRTNTDGRGNIDEKSFPLKFRDEYDTSFNIGHNKTVNVRFCGRIRVFPVALPRRAAANSILVHLDAYPSAVRGGFYKNLILIIIFNFYGLFGLVSRTNPPPTLAVIAVGLILLIVEIHRFGS